MSDKGHRAVMCVAGFATMVLSGVPMVFGLYFVDRRKGDLGHELFYMAIGLTGISVALSMVGWGISAIKKALRP